MAVEINNQETVEQPLAALDLREELGVYKAVILKGF